MRTVMVLLALVLFGNVAFGQSCNSGYQLRAAPSYNYNYNYQAPANYYQEEIGLFLVPGPARANVFLNQGYSYNAGFGQSYNNNFNLNYNNAAALARLRAQQNYQAFAFQAGLHPVRSGGALGVGRLFSSGAFSNLPPGTVINVQNNQRGLINRSR